MKTVRFFLIIFLVAALGAFLSLHLFSFRYIEKYLLANGGSDLIPIEIIEEREVIIRENEAIVENINRIERAIIGIKTGSVEGSGLIVSSDGLVVTFSSIIPYGGDFNFFINGEKASYEVLKRDVQSGMALVKLEKSGLPTLEFGNVEQLKIGERVFVIGTVFNEKGEVQKSVNEGIIKRLDKYIKTSIIEENRLWGSTLFDVEGKVLGLNMINQRGEIYTIPIDRIQEFVGL